MQIPFTRSLQNGLRMGELKGECNMKKTFFFLIVIMILAACVSVPAVETSATPILATIMPPALSPEPRQESAAATSTLSIEEPLMVAFAKDGDLHLWDS